MTDAAARAVVSAFYEAYAARNPDAAAALYAADGSHEEVATGQVKNGRDDIAAGLAHFFAAFPDATWETAGPYWGTDGVAVPYTLRGTLRSRFGTFEPREQHLELRGVHVLELAGGTIARTYDYWDAGTFGKQMRAEQPGSEQSAAARSKEGT